MCVPPSGPARTEPDGVFLLVPAGGRGLRMGGGVPKQFRDWGGQPLLKATLAAFRGHGMPQLDGIALAVPPEYLEEVTTWDLGVPLWAVCGGDTRQASVAQALAALPARPRAVVMIHDGVRPFPPADAVCEALDALADWDGAVLVEASTDTLKEVDADGRILRTLDRTVIHRAQTPQMARLGLWQEAMAWAEANGFLGTDDVSLLEAMGRRVKAVMAPPSNLKLTTPEDWERLQPRS